MDDVETKEAARVRGSLLLVDADVQGAEDLAEALRGRGYRVACATRLPEPFDEACGPPPLAVLLDYGSLAGQAAATVRTLRAVLPDACVVILSRIASLAGAVACVKAGADQFLTKPVTADELVVLLARETGEPAPKAAPSVTDTIHAHILATLRSVDDNLPVAARLLQMETRTLRRMLARQS